MGCCVSTSNRSNGDAGPSSCLELGLCCQKKERKALSDHVVSLHKLSSLPNRIFANGKSRSSCIFTQQGRKGINQDAMIVWEVSMFMFMFMLWLMMFDSHRMKNDLTVNSLVLIFVLFRILGQKM